ncbi:MAG TPA: tetratricopeptide repeat protein [Thermoanaerobaculia bacterium]
MKQRIRRKDLKRNELAETMGRTVDYVSHHRKGVTEGIVIGACAVALVAGVFLFRAYRESAAGSQLSKALAILDTPIAGSPGATGPRTYATAAERDRLADRHLRAAAGYGGTAAGRAAGVILAARDPKLPKAPEDLSRAARDGKGEVAAAAEIGEARLLVASGKAPEAIDRLRRAIDSPQSRAPKDALLFALAQAYEKTGAMGDAKATYQRLVNDYPNSAYRPDARAALPGSSGPGGI